MNEGKVIDLEYHYALQLLQNSFFCYFAVLNEPRNKGNFN